MWGSLVIRRTYYVGIIGYRKEEILYRDHWL